MQKHGSRVMLGPTLLRLQRASTGCESPEDGPTDRAMRESAMSMIV